MDLDLLQKQAEALDNYNAGYKAALQWMAQQQMAQADAGVKEEGPKPRQPKPQNVDATVPQGN